jgi:hypothetical protein
MEISIPASSNSRRVLLLEFHAMAENSAQDQDDALQQNEGDADVAVGLGTEGEILNADH